MQQNKPSSLQVFVVKLVEKRPPESENVKHRKPSCQMEQLAQAEPRAIQHSEATFGHRRASAGERASRFLGSSGYSLVILYTRRRLYAH